VEPIPEEFLFASLQDKFGHNIEIFALPWFETSRIMQIEVFIFF